MKQNHRYLPHESYLEQLPATERPENAVCNFKAFRSVLSGCSHVLPLSEHKAIYPGTLARIKHKYRTIRCARRVDQRCGFRAHVRACTCGAMSSSQVHHMVVHHIKCTGAHCRFAKVAWRIIYARRARAPVMKKSTCDWPALTKIWEFDKTLSHTRTRMHVLCTVYFS